MKLEFEVCDNPEVAAATTQSPEEVIVLHFAGVQLTAISRNDIRGEQIVYGHAVLSAQPTEAAAKCQAGNPVVELMPSGVARPCTCAAASKSARVQPGSTIARRAF